MGKKGRTIPRKKKDSQQTLHKRLFLYSFSLFFFWFLLGLFFGQRECVMVAAPPLFLSLPQRRLEQATADPMQVFVLHFPFPKQKTFAFLFRIWSLSLPREKPPFVCGCLFVGDSLCPSVHMRKQTGRGHRDRASAVCCLFSVTEAARWRKARHWIGSPKSVKKMIREQIIKRKKGKRQKESLRKGGNKNAFWCGKKVRVAATSRGRRDRQGWRP